MSRLRLRILNTNICQLSVRFGFESMLINRNGFRQRIYLNTTNICKGLYLFYVYTWNINTMCSPFKINIQTAKLQPLWPFIFINRFCHVSDHYKCPTHLAAQICKSLCKRFADAGDYRMIYRFQQPVTPGCCPKIRLWGWQKASHCTLVIALRAFGYIGK